MIESNSLIRASAGTGKTFALATRFIRQMLIDRVDPKTIVALTFSRAAAQEIYTKILLRLCGAAGDEAGAKREWEFLLADFRQGAVPAAAEKLAWIERNVRPPTAADFRRLLRALVETQHLGAIATIDSFILRIVKNFPKEMGFQNAVEVLDPIDEDLAVEETLRGLLARSDAPGGAAVAAAFVRTQDGAFARTCLGTIERILNKEGWRDFALTHPESRDWTVESMCAALGVPVASDCPDLSNLPFNDVGRKNAVSPEESFVRFARGYDGSTHPLDVSDGVRKLMLHFWNDPTATSYAYTFYKPFVFDCGTDGAAAIRGAIRHLSNVYLKRQIEIVRAKLDLVQAVEDDYERQTRRAGRLTFNDFTKFSAENEFSERGIAIQNVQFRFDSQFDHWALDEFQDTSELQWRCLRELVKAVADAGRAGETRSAMAVGDMKQSIYVWRGASAQPFEQLASWPSFDGCTRDFRESHRYGPNIAAFVNRVFGRENISCDGIVPAACADAAEAWAAGWTDHVSHEAADYVQVIAAPKNADPEADDELLPALYDALRPLWDAHVAAGSTDTVGVLVRTNGKGLKVAEYLRAKGLPVVWEGMNPVRDLPVVEALLALLRLGEHPGDVWAWRTVNDLFPVRELLLPECADAAAVSAAVLRLLTRQGLARTLKDFCGVLRAQGGFAENGLVHARLRQLVEAAVAFESRATAGGADAFARFLAEAAKREIAVSSDVIRVLTIHRSKGLGIDHVFVPLFEQDRAKSAIDFPSTSTPLFDGGGWVLSHLPKGCEFLNEKTDAAYAKMRSARFAEALRTYYVALTRAKKSLFVLFPDDSDPADYPKGLLMRDLVVQALGPTFPRAFGEPPVFRPHPAAAPATPAKRPGWRAEGVRTLVERVSPSQTTVGGVSRGRSGAGAAALFGADYGAAARHGVDVHAAYQRIAWADEATAATLPAAFRSAFVKPAADATVWRERAYELFDGRRWETGQFDRVVFAGAGAARTATIYDFKTNVRGEGESADDFARHMVAAYAAQLTAYRRALHVLTGLPLERIKAVLLLEDIARAVCMP